MIDYGNGGMPGDGLTPEQEGRLEYVERQERSDRSPASPIPEESSPAVYSERIDWCICAGLSEASKLNPGPHHDEGCVMFALPDYGVFGPDE